MALAHGLRLSVALIVPVTVGIFILARPVVMLLFEHGSFTPYDTAMTGLALRLYLIGLPFHAVDLLLVFAFYARQDTLTPALIGVGAAAVYVVLAAGLLPVVGLFAIMVADAVKIILHTAVSLWLLRRRVGGGFEGVPRTLARAGLAAAVMGAAVYVVWQGGALLFGGATGLLPELLTVALPAAVGGGVYLALLHRLGVTEVTRLWQSVRQRI
ncbi:MAG: polysaccharide biosynthesis C-terminal domain-containing protein [Anaerolineae bacterium]|nr:polysaccharide biosynthesis C-terminal domain-containing protein [Anaerolineae bacterium]